MTRSPASDPSKWGMAQADIMRATKPQPGKDSGGPAHSHASDNSLRRVALPYPDFMPARGSRPRLHRLLDPAQAHRRRQAAPPTALARRSASARAISTRSRPRRASILSTLPPTSSSLLLPHSPWSRLDACAISSGARDGEQDITPQTVAKVGAKDTVVSQKTLLGCEKTVKHLAKDH